MTAITMYTERDTLHSLIDWQAGDLELLQRDLAPHPTFKMFSPAEKEILAGLDFVPSIEKDHRVIGVHGFAQTGKDTVVSRLVERFGFEQVVLAYPILQHLLALDPIVATDTKGRVFRFKEVYEAEGYEGAKKTLEFRRLMQVYGTEVGRELLGKALGLPHSVWIEIATNTIEQPGRYAISDVRFPDEVEMVRKAEGFLVKVKRPGYGPINSHASDAGLPDHLFDLVIDNDGTLEDLHRKVDGLMAKRAV